MEKFNVVLVVLNANNLSTALESLNFERANLVAVVIENGSGNFFTLNDKKIPLVSFANIGQL